MALSTPEVSLGTGLAVAVLAYGVFEQHLPPTADIRTCESGNRDVHASAKSAAWISAAAVAGVSLVSKDGTIFTIGGLAILALYWTTQHANHVSPLTGKVNSGGMTIDDMVAAQGGLTQVGGTSYDSII